MIYKLYISMILVVLLWGSFSIAYYNNTPQAISGSGDISQEMTIDYNDYLQSTKEQDRETE